MNEEILNQAKLKSEDETFFDRNVNRVHFIVWALGILFAGLITATTWIVLISRDVKATVLISEKNQTRLDSMDTAIKVKVEADGRTYDSLKVLINSAIDELKKREKEKEEIDELWFMKEHGISIKEDFFARHGFPPPVSSTVPYATPSATPK